jgi:hypothetical protein
VWTLKEKKKEVFAMVETIEVFSSLEPESKLNDNFNVPVIFVEDRDEEVDGQIITGLSHDHYSPSVRVVYVSKPADATSGFGFHLSRSKWDPYPYISRVDKASFASSSGLREGDCVLEVKSSFFHSSNWS